MCQRFFNSEILIPFSGNLDMLYLYANPKRIESLPISRYVYGYSFMGTGLGDTGVFCGTTVIICYGFTLKCFLSF